MHCSPVVSRMAIEPIPGWRWRQGEADPIGAAAGIAGFALFLWSIWLIARMW